MGIANLPYADTITVTIQSVKRFRIIRQAICPNQLTRYADHVTFHPPDIRSGEWSSQMITQEVTEPKGDKARTREVSTIGFPYVDLEDAIQIARGIHETTGASPCKQDQLAAKLKVSMTSSGYRQRLSAARMFGVIEHDRGGSSAVRLTPLGQMIVDASRQREARVKAFLSVPLYRKLHDHYLGKILPPATALTREIILLGVAQKQADRARQIFERSAEHAEFFAMGRDRLVMPGGGSETSFSIEEKPKEKDANGNGQPPPPTPPRHPFIEGLLQALPEPEKDWPAAGRVKWLQTAANIFDLIYKGDGGIKIELAMAQRSPRPSE